MPSLKTKGFTLVELLIVIAIIAILAVIGLVFYNGLQKTARDSKRLADVNNIAKAMENHFDSQKDIYSYPIIANWFIGGIPFDPLNTGYKVLRNANSSGFQVCANLEKVTNSFCLTSTQGLFNPTNAVDISPIPVSGPTSIPTSTPASSSTPIPSPSGPTNYIDGLAGVDSSGCSGGTQANPWKTWPKAQSCIIAGTTVYFKSGTYTAPSSFTFNGTAASPITIKPAPGSEGAVKLTGSFKAEGQYGVMDGFEMDFLGGGVGVNFYGNHITVQNSNIHNVGLAANDCTHAFKNTIDIKIINNLIYDCAEDGFDSTGTDGVVVRGNLIHDTGQGGIQLKGGTKNVLVEKNKIYNIAQNAIYATSTGSNSTSVYGADWVHDPSVPMASRYQGKDYVIKNNIIYSTNGSNIIRSSGWVNYQITNNTFYGSTVSNAIIINAGDADYNDSTAQNYCQSNSCVSCGTVNGQACFTIPAPSLGGIIKNNVFKDFSSTLMNIAAGSDTPTISNNIYYRAGLTPSTASLFKRNGINLSFSQFTTQGYDSNSQIADPQFLSTNSSDASFLHLNAGSPAIDTGINLTSLGVIDDLENHTRPHGAAFDIGAFEF